MNHPIRSAAAGLALPLFLISSVAHAANVLVVLSDADRLALRGGRAYPTGFYANELASRTRPY